MQASLLLAGLLGPYLVIVGLGILTNTKRIQQVAHEYTQSAALMYIGGVIALIFGLLILLFHNRWVANWTVIITVLGWITVLKGTVLIVYPEHMKKLAQRYVDDPKLARVQSVCVIIVGAFLIFKGYCMP